MTATTGFTTNADDINSAAVIDSLTYNLQAIPRPQLKTGKLGLSIIPRNYNVSEQSWTEYLKLTQKLGVQAIQVPSGYWYEDEPVKDAYQWQSMQSLIRAMDDGGFDFEITQDFGGPFFHDKLTAPAYLNGFDLGDPEFRRRYIKYLDSYLTRFGSRITTLLIHAEGAYNFFDKHPEKLQDYLVLLKMTRAHINKKWPYINFGINTDPHNTPDLLDAFSTELDIVGFDLVFIDGFLQSPQGVDNAIQVIVQNTNGKPVSIAAGWSSSGAGGSKDAQQQFLQNIFQSLVKHRQQIRYLILGPLFDEKREIVEPAYRSQFSSLPEQFVTDIIDWITTLGWIDQNGIKKPVFRTALSEIRGYYGSTLSEKVESEKPALTE